MTKNVESNPYFPKKSVIKSQKNEV